MDKRPPAPPVPSRWLHGHVLSWVGLVAVALVLTRAALGVIYDQQRFEEASTKELESRTRQLEAHLHLAMESVNQTLAVQAALLMAANGAHAEAARRNELLAQALVGNRLIRSLALVDVRGRVLSSSQPSQVGREVNLLRIGLPVPGQPAQFGALATGDKAEAFSLHLTRAAYTAAEPKRYLVATLNAAQLGLGTVLGNGDDGLSAALMQADGEVLFSAPPMAARGPSQPSWGVSPHPYANALTAHLESSQMMGTGLQGVPVFSALRALRGQPLTVVVEQDQAQARASNLVSRLVVRNLTDLLALLLVGASWAILRKQGLAQQAMATAILANDRTLRQSEDALALMLAHVRELIFRADALGHITFVNSHWEASTGLPASAILGRHFADLVEPEDRSRVEALFRPRPGALVDPVLVRLQGRSELLSLDLSVTAVGSRQPGEAGFVGIALDLTERRNVRERLQDRLDFAMRLLDVSPTAMFAKDTEGRYIEVNRAFLELVGLSLQQVLGQTTESLFPDPEGRQAAADHHVLSTGETVTYEGQLSSPDGKVRTTRITKSRLTYGNGKPAGIVGSSVDVTLYRQAEQTVRDARDASVRAAKAKLEFERGFLSMAAHELRTPLTGLRLQAQLIVDAPTDGDRRRLSQELLSSVDRIGHVLEQLMILSRVDGLRYSKLDRVSVDLQATYFKVMSQLQEEAAERGIRLRARLHGCHIVGVEFGIYTVMRNLLHNAILYTPQDGQVCIEAHIAGDTATLLVDDSGPGIPVAQRELAFARFNRLGQQRIKGSGLGLSIVKNIAALHGAVVRLETSALGGLRVAVDFPAARPEAPQFLESAFLEFEDTRPADL